MRTARVGGVTVSLPKDIVLPQFDNGYVSTTIDGVEYRVRTFTAGKASIAVGAPLAETLRRIDELHRRVLLICGGVIVATLVVASVLWLIMINPFRVLAEQARAINAQSNPDEVKVRGVQEAVEIAEAVEGMLARIGDEQQRTRAALESARDFAAVASHELRTPLTAMRTNLEVLSTLDLPDEQRKEVIADVIRTQSRIEATLSALERLAQGELTTVDDFVPVDITELLDRAAHDAMRNYPDLARVARVADHRADGRDACRPAAGHRQRDHQRRQAWRSHRDPPGRNQFHRRCGDHRRRQRPRRARRGAAAVFDRFSRGSTAARSGSGLGLALVAQQAEIHGGTAALETSPMGGARLLLRLPPPSLASGVFGSSPSSSRCMVRHIWSKFFSPASADHRCSMSATRPPASAIRSRPRSVRSISLALPSAGSGRRVR